jgi:hypothetical protein
MAAMAAGLSYAELVLWVVMNAKLSNGMIRDSKVSKTFKAEI